MVENPDQTLQEALAAELSGSELMNQLDILNRGGVEGAGDVTKGQLANGHERYFRVAFDLYSARFEELSSTDIDSIGEALGIEPLQYRNIMFLVGYRIGEDMPFLPWPEFGTYSFIAAPWQPSGSEENTSEGEN